jgi:UDP:flavonoid glycosyltransferase YjiC (YdhE family)
MKIGFISMPLTGHLNPMTALARKLQSRGHEIVFIGVPDVGPTVRAAGLNFVSYCEEEFPAGACASALAPVARIHGTEATRWTIGGAGRAFFQAASQHLPFVLAETGVEALVLDTIHMYLEIVPMSLGIPYAHVWAILNQFGVAARIAYRGVGEFLGFDGLSVDALHALIQRVLNTHSYREKAAYFRNIIAQRRGLDVAAEAIERAFEAALVNCALELSRS